MAAKAKTIKVKALTALHENGVSYAPGDEIETTPERAAALGPHVEGAPAAPATEE